MESTQVTPRKIEQYSDVELMNAFWAYFGRKGVGMLGWCFVCALSGETDSTAFQQRLQQRGLTKSGLYHALDAVRAFREHIEGQPLPRRDASYAMEMLRRLSSASVL